MEDLQIAVIKLNEGLERLQMESGKKVLVAPTGGSFKSNLSSRRRVAEDGGIS